MGLGIALKAFFTALGNNEKADQISQILSGESTVAKIEPPESASAPEVKKVALPPTRDTAVTLLATLQREARLIDLIHEDLGQYSDAQVGAAARPCLQQCAGVLDRLMSLQPLVDASEGDTLDIAEDASPTRFQWVGEGTAATGKLVHHGWQATKVELPTWTGAEADAKIIAPAQVQAP